VGSRCALLRTTQKQKHFHIDRSFLMPETPKERTIMITDTGTGLKISADGIDWFEAIGILELAKHNILETKSKTVLPRCESLN
jgi:hypothetical protein